MIPDNGMKITRVLTAIFLTSMSFLIFLNYDVYAYDCSDYNRVYEELIKLKDAGDKLFFYGDFDQAIEYYNSTLEIIEACGNYYNLAVSYDLLGKTYAQKGETKIALEYYNKSLVIYRQTPNLEPGEIAALGNYGKVYFLSGDLEKAKDIYDEVKELAGKNNYSHEKYISIANIGAYYREKGNYSLAKQYHLEAFLLFNQSSDYLNAAGQLIDLGSIELSQNNIYDSLSYYQKAEEIIRKYNFSFLFDEILNLEANVYYNLGIYYLSRDDYRGSLSELEKGFDKSIEGLAYSNNTFLILGYISLARGDVLSMQENSNESIRYYYIADNYFKQYSSYQGNNNQIGTVIKFNEAKIEFEKSKIMLKNFEYEQAASSLNESLKHLSELKYSKTIRYLNKSDMIEAYYYYTLSKIYQIRYIQSGESGYKELSNEMLTFARRNFEKLGKEDLARLMVREKLINYPSMPITIDETALLFGGLTIYDIDFDTELYVSQSGKITLDLIYQSRIPPEGLPRIIFCCQDNQIKYCSDWIKIIDNTKRQIKIDVSSSNPMKIICDPKIFSEINENIELGYVRDYYEPGLNVESEIIKEDNRYSLTVKMMAKHYQTVAMNIKFTLRQQIWEFLRKIPILASLISLFFLRNKILKLFKHVWAEMKKTYRLYSHN